MLSPREKELQTYLEGFLTERRLERMNAVLDMRTRYITCVLEDLYDPRNGSAVIRHCDALGIHELHAIENKHRFRSDGQVDMGTSQWMDMHVYRREEGAPLTVKARRRAAAASGDAPPIPTQTPDVLAGLKKRGYRIAATSPHAADDAVPETLDLNAGPVAVVFGTEKYGISDEVRDAADVFLRIPMVGFVESFNISASAAIVLYTLTLRMRRDIPEWRLDDEDRERTLFNWIRSSAPHARDLIQRFESERGSD